MERRGEESGAITEAITKRYYQLMYSMRTGEERECKGCGWKASGELDKLTENLEGVLKECTGADEKPTKVLFEASCILGKQFL